MKRISCLFLVSLEIWLTFEEYAGEEYAGQI